MTARFILGPAGSGKTAHCLRAMAAALEDDPVAGPPCLLLVPEQASLQSERALLATLRRPGTSTGAVYSFRRLAEVVLAQRPRAGARPLSPAGRAMVVQRLLAEHRADLRFFRGSPLQPGLHRLLGEQIEEFIAAGVTAGALQPPPRTSPDLVARLHDLQILYRGYLDFLAGGFLDPGVQLEAVGPCLPALPLMRQARIWVDGFAGFTNQEARVLVDLACQCARMEIALLIDPAELPAASEPPDPYALFAPVERTHRLLLAEFTRHGVTIEPPLLLPQAGASRFRMAADLAHLQAQVFRDNRPLQAAAPDVHLYQASDPRDEIGWVVQRIQELVRDPLRPLRYRDIAVITRRVADHAAGISAALQRSAIPHFVDRRVPLSEHPLYGFLTALLRLQGCNPSADFLRALIKSPLARLSAADADVLDDALRAPGHSALTRGGRQAPAGPAARGGLRRATLIRDRMMRRLRPWLAVLESEPQPARSLAAALFETLTSFHVGRMLDGWARREEQAGGIAQALRHRSAWTALVDLLDDVVDILGDHPLSPPDFAATLEAGLAQLDVGLAPPAIDQVMVGSIDRSRHADIQAVFIVGFNDGQFPQPRPEPQLLDDAQRTALIEAGLPIDPPRSQRPGEERLLTYVALTRAARKLYLSWPVLDAAGGPLEPSPYLRDIRQALPQAAVEQAPAETSARRIGRVSSAADLAEILARHFSARAAGMDPPPGPRRAAGADADADEEDRAGLEADRAAWAGLYERARRRPELAPSLRRGLAGLTASNETVLVAAAPALPATLASSASELALYAQCPFKHFAACRLQLQAGPAERSGPLELGQVFHELLDLFTRRLLADELSLCDLDDAEIERRLALAGGELCDRTAPGPDGADEFSWLTDRAIGELGSALAVQRDQQRAGLCRTAASELWFGGTDAVILESPQGRRLELRGRIDRLDLAGTAAFVLDYKSSAGVKVSLSEMYHGWNIQLPVYLLAASRLKTKGQERPLQPAGAFFLPLSPAPLDVEHPDEAEYSRLKAYQPRGLFDARFIAELDRAAGAGGSRIVGYKLSQGRPSRRAGSDAWSAEELQALLNHIRARLGEMADVILDGDVRVAPSRLGSRLACEQCPFGAVCRVDPADNDIRRLQKISRQQFNPRSKDDG